MNCLQEVEQNKEQFSKYITYDKYSMSGISFRPKKNQYYFSGLFLDINRLIGSK